VQAAATLLAVTGLSPDAMPSDFMPCSDFMLSSDFMASDCMLSDDIAPEDSPDFMAFPIEWTAAICALLSIAVKSAQLMSLEDI
jgi:hypothetical protein